MAERTATSSGVSLATRVETHDRTAAPPKKGATETVVDTDDVGRSEHPVHGDLEPENLKPTDEENLVRGEVIIRDGKCHSWTMG